MFRKKKLTDKQKQKVKQRTSAKISSALRDNDNSFSNDAISLLQGLEGNVGAACHKCLKEKKCTSQGCRSCRKECKGVDTDEMEDEMSPEQVAALKKQLKASKKKKKKFTSEPIPDYIMRALQPKKSVHPVYGNLRY